MQDRASRCEAHPGAAAVAECSGCGRGLCLKCAIPVRGKVLGPECLPEDLRAEAPAPAPQKRVRMRYPWTGVGLAIAVAASFFPWKKYGLGSGPFGAWGWTLRWSVLAATAAVLGFVVWATVSLVGLRPGSAWRGTLRVLVAAVAIGALLHLLRRPGFGPHSVGPWIALAGAAIGLAGTYIGLRARPGPI